VGAEGRGYGKDGGEGQYREGEGGDGGGAEREQVGRWLWARGDGRGGERKVGA